MKNSTEVRIAGRSVSAALLLFGLVCSEPLNAQAPTISAEGIVNAATGLRSASVPVAARGSLISIYGQNLSHATISADAAPFPVQLGGTQVFIGGIAAPLLYVSANQVNVLVPFEVPDVGSTDLFVQNESGSSAVTQLTLLAQDPGIFEVFKSGFPVGPSNPISAGDSITIYATGLGVVVPPVPTGQPAPSSPLAIAAIPPVVKVGGQRMQVSFAGLAPGLVVYQINATAPPTLAGQVAEITVEPGVGQSLTARAAGIFRLPYGEFQGRLAQPDRQVRQDRRGRRVQPGRQV